MVHNKRIAENELKEILMEEYNFKLINFKDVRAAIKVTTDQGKFGFVKAGSKRKTTALDAFLKYLEKNNFHQIAKLYPTAKGQYFVHFGLEKVKLIQWIDGVECNLSNHTILSETAATYARFHQASKGFVAPPKSKWKTNIGKWPENFQKRYDYILQVKKECLAKTNKSEFEKIFLNSVDHFLKDMKTAIDLLINSNYQELVKKELEAPHTIHHSCYYQNLIYGNNKLVYIIDYGKLMMDLPVHDISNLMIRHVRHKDWNFNDAKIIIDSYQKVRPLSNSELELLKILIYFPERYIKIIEKYHKEEKDNKYLIKHLSHLIKEIPLRHKFIANFEKNYL